MAVGGGLRGAWFVLGLGAWLVACGGGAAEPGADGDDGDAWSDAADGGEDGADAGDGLDEPGPDGLDGEADGAGEEDGPLVPAAPLVVGLELAEVAVFQAPKLPLALGGEAVAPRAPLVAGREALLRVYVRPLVGFVPGPVRAEAELEAPGSDPLLLAAEREVSGPSSDAEPASVFDLLVPAARVVPGATFRLRLVRAEGEEGVPGVPHPARHPRDGARAALPVADPGPLRLMLVPVRYDRDGSGRLPDTGPAQLERYRALLTALYPLARVELEVHAPHPWSHALGLTGSFRFGLLNEELVAMRAAEQAPPDVYYYGLVAPDVDFGAYCGWSCTTGQSFQVVDPEDADIRVGSGLGFGGEDSAWTLAHELGHLHGRWHAPCGGADDPDPDFPYPGGGAGVWGWDPRDRSFLDPAGTRDFMSYCDPAWVSDYTFAGLQARIAAVHLLAPSPAPRRAYRFVDLGPGGPAWGPAVTLARLPAGTRVEVEALDGHGRARSLEPGVWLEQSGGARSLLVPAPPRGAVRVRVGGLELGDRRRSR